MARELRCKRLDNLPEQSVLDAMRDFAFIVSPNADKLLYVNVAACEYLGWSAEEIVGCQQWQDQLLEPESHAVLQQLLSLASGSPLLLQHPQLNLRGAGGMWVGIEVHALLQAADAIVFLGSSGVSAESAEEILRQTNARFRSIVDSLSINLVLKDREGRRVYANQSYLEYRNLELASILGRKDTELFPPDLAADFARDDEHVLATGKLIHKFEENVRADGQRTWAEIIKGPIRDADNNITGVQILFWDATARKETELELERERYLLHALLDNIPDSIYFKDAESRFVRISRGMAEKFNLKDPSVAIGKTDADIFTAEHAEQALRDERRIMETGQPIVAQVERETWPDRDDTWCSTTKLPLRDADGKVVGTFGISRDVTELIAIESQLREARDQADLASRAKSEFLANMSHEIRTPMNGIIGMAELLSHTRLSDTQMSYLGMIQQSAESLLRIINDILDFSKIEAGKLDIESIPFDLPRAVSEAAKGLAIRAAKKGIELKLEIETDVPTWVVGDADRLRQVIINLAGNSIKFTESGSIAIRIDVAAGPPADSDYMLHFAVSDTGIGIPANKQATIFGAFSQADVSTTRTYGGTGLGLSISSQLVEMMGGKIWLESEVGVGSTFHFNVQFKGVKPGQHAGDGQDTDVLRSLQTLLIDQRAGETMDLLAPLRRRGLQVARAQTREEAVASYYDLPDAPQRCVMIVDQQVGEQDGVQLIEQLQSMAPDKRPITILLSSLPDPIAARSSEKLRSVVILQKPVLYAEICEAIRRFIDDEENSSTEEESNELLAVEPLRLLVAEDGEVNRAILLGLLGELGHDVKWVEDGQAAYELFQACDFDAILMDIQMPILDGLEATVKIRQFEAAVSKKDRIPIIAITAGAMQRDELQCFEAGMDDYLSKPIDFGSLKSMLARLQDQRYRGIPFVTELRSTDSRLSPRQSSVSGEMTPSILDFDAPVQRFKATKAQQVSLVETLRKETIQRLNELSTAIEKQDGKLLVRASHSLKSAAAMFNARKVKHESATIEAAARSGDFFVASQHFTNLRDLSYAMLKEIDMWLDSQSD